MAVAAVAAAAVLGLRAYLHREYSAGGCVPCADLATCRPLALSLEVTQPWPRAGRTYTVWHRARLANASCVDLPAFDGATVKLTYKVWDPSGRELAPQPAARSEYGAVVPYRHAAAAAVAALPPGASWRTPAMTLSPYTLRPALMSVGKGREVKTFNQDAEVPAAAPRGAVAPPPGFQVLRGYVFSRPGRYTIAAVYQGGPTTLTRLFPNYAALPEKAKGWLDELAARARLDLRPSGKTSRALSAESEPASFEVLP